MPFTTSDNNYGVAKWIVDPVPGQGTHTTIQSAVTDAAAVQVATGNAQTIFIRPSTYTENITLAVSVNLTAFDCDAITPSVTIVGKCTAGFSGTCSLSGIKLKTNSDFFLDVTTSSATVVNLISCFLTPQTMMDYV